MKNTADKVLLLGMLLVFLSASTGVEAEHGNRIIAGTLFNPVHHSTLSASTVLEHNKRLLHGTSIGKTLLKKTNAKADDLYTQAYRLYQEAINSFQSGKVIEAKDFASQSIHIIYRADRHRYNLEGNVSSQ